MSNKIDPLGCLCCLLLWGILVGEWLFILLTNLILLLWEWLKNPGKTRGNLLPDEDQWGKFGPVDQTLYPWSHDDNPAAPPHTKPPAEGA